MNERIIGRVKRVNGPVITAEGVSNAMMLEHIQAGEDRLEGEIVKLSGEEALIQIYEDTTGISPGDYIYGSSMPISVELGPGLLGSIFDGIQRPLGLTGKTSNDFIKKGMVSSPLSRDKKWHFIPKAKTGEFLSGGMVIGTVLESRSINHKILIPPGVKGELLSIAAEGDYVIEESIGELLRNSKKTKISMMQNWSIRKARPVLERLPLEIPLITGQRVIDSLFPLAKGGAVAIPGGFGTGKTMTQHAIAKFCDADVIIYIGCGERGNEMTDVLSNFPKLIDPLTGNSLMERTILIANTSNMPVSAREASIYTGITMAEYYRDQGFHVAVMADSTSRWAEALRELSGRMEEMPAEEGFPAYLPSRIAQFYERAGYMATLSGSIGSVTIIGAISPPGGDFSEPVTQHTKRYVRCFWCLDRQLAYSRHYPAISWLDSYSEYSDDVNSWWEERTGNKWRENRKEILELLVKEIKLKQIVKLVGPDALPDSQRFIIEVCTLFKNAFLQQSVFDKIDCFTTVGKQMRMIEIILLFHRKGGELIKKGIPIIKLRRLKILQSIINMKLTARNDDLQAFDKLEMRLLRAMERLEGIHV